MEAFGPYPLLSAAVIAVSIFALWQRSAIGWIVAGIANAGLVWLILYL